LIKLQKQRDAFRIKPSALAGMLLCLALLTLLTVVQVAHVHSVDTDADHCPLCIVLHTAAPVAAAAAMILLVQVKTAAPIFEMRAVTRHWHPQLFTRPPPLAEVASLRRFVLAR
jgi:hypothetical protein